MTPLRTSGSALHFAQQVTASTSVMITAVITCDQSTPISRLRYPRMSVRSSDFRAAETLFFATQWARGGREKKPPPTKALTSERGCLGAFPARSRHRQKQAARAAAAVALRSAVAEMGVRAGSMRC